LSAGPEGMLPDCRPKLKNLYAEGKTFIVTIAKSRTDTSYLVDGFASFKLCGYAIGGGYIESSCSICPLDSPSNFRICGTFQTLTLEGGNFGNATDYGTRILKMVG